MNRYVSGLLFTILNIAHMFGTCQAINELTLRKPTEFGNFVEDKWFYWIERRRRRRRKPMVQNQTSRKHSLSKYRMLRSTLEIIDGNGTWHSFHTTHGAIDVLNRTKNPIFLDIVDLSAYTLDDKSMHTYSHTHKHNFFQRYYCYAKCFQIKKEKFFWASNQSHMWNLKESSNTTWCFHHNSKFNEYR